MNYFYKFWIIFENFAGARTDVFEAAIGRPWIEPNDAVFTLKLIFGLARNGLDFGPKNDLKIIFLNNIWKTKIHKFTKNSQWNIAFLENKIIIYISKILNIIENSFKKLHMKSLRFASTKRIWKAIFIEETRRNVLRLCKNFWFLLWKWIYKVYFLERNAHSWFFTKPKTSWFFREELRPFGAHWIRSLIENFAWFGSIQGLEINAQNRRGGVHLLSCGAAQSEGNLSL